MQAPSEGAEGVVLREESQEAPDEATEPRIGAIKGDSSYQSKSLV